MTGLRRWGKASNNLLLIRQLHRGDFSSTDPSLRKDDGTFFVFKGRNCFKNGLFGRKKEGQSVVSVEISLNRAILASDLK